MESWVIALRVGGAVWSTDRAPDVEEQWGAGTEPWIWRSSVEHIWRHRCGGVVWGTYRALDMEEQCGAHTKLQMWRSSVDHMQRPDVKEQCGAIWSSRLDVLGEGCASKTSWEAVGRYSLCHGPFCFLLCFREECPLYPMSFLSDREQAYSAGATTFWVAPPSLRSQKISCKELKRPPQKTVSWRDKHY